MKFTNIAPVGNLEFNDLGQVTKGVSLQSRYITLLPGESIYLPDGQDVMYSAQVGDAARYSRVGKLQINEIVSLTGNAGLTPSFVIPHNFGFIPRITIAQLTIGTAPTVSPLITINDNGGTFTSGSITARLYINGSTTAVTVTTAWGVSKAATLTAFAAAIQVAIRAAIVGDASSTAASAGQVITISPKTGNTVAATASVVRGNADTVTVLVQGPWVDVSASMAVVTDAAMLNTVVSNPGGNAAILQIRIS